MFDEAFGTKDKLVIIISTLLFQPDTETAVFWYQFYKTVPDALSGVGSILLRHLTVNVDGLI